VKASSRRRSEAIYERASGTVRCLTCVSGREVLGEEPRSAPDELPAAVDPGVPDASARREYERRHVRRQERIHSEHRRLGELILAMSSDPQSTRAWDTGALGEERLGARLNELVDDSLRVLHDRRIVSGDGLAQSGSGGNRQDSVGDQHLGSGRRCGTCRR
jgi:hypothetical protein